MRPAASAKRRETDVLARPHDGKALFDVGAVEANERHHVGNRRQRHEIEKRQKIGLACRLIKSASPQFARNRDENQEHDARRTERPLPRHVVLAVRIDDRIDLGKVLVRLMVIDDEDVGAETARQCQRFVARRAAIDRNDQPGSLADQRLDGTGVRSVALEQPIRNVDPRRRLVVPQKPRQQRRRAGAVNVVVAENRNGLPAFDRVGEARRGLVHVTQEARVRHQRFERRIEERRHIVEPNAASREHTAHQLGQAVALAYRRCERLCFPQEALTPDETARTCRDAKKGQPLGAPFNRNFRQTRRAQLSPAPCRLSEL